MWSTWAILLITSLISLCNFFCVLDTSRFFIVGMYAFCFFIPFFFSVRHSSNDYHWKIHITVVGIFMVNLLSVDYLLDSIGMLGLIPYSFISNYFYFHVCLCYAYFGSEKLGLKKMMDIYNNTKILIFFEDLKF